MNDNIFEELVIYILTYPGVSTSHRNGLISKLEAHGAEVRARFGKDVTHVVVQQTHSATGDDRVAGDAQLRGLFDKIAKGHEIVQTVSMGWVQKCLECQRRVMERPFALQRPHEPILAPGKSAATAGRSAKKRRIKGGPAVAGGTSKKVAQAAALDVNEPLFSSSQQLQDLRDGAAAGAAGGQLLPDLSPMKQPRNIRVVFSDQLQQQQQQLRGLSAREAAAAARFKLKPPPAAVVLKATRINCGPATQDAAAILERLADGTLQESAFDDADHLPGLTVHWKTPAAATTTCPAAATAVNDDVDDSAAVVVINKQHSASHKQQQQQQEVVEPSENVIADSDDDHDAGPNIHGFKQRLASSAEAADEAAAAGGGSTAAAAGSSGALAAAGCHQHNSIAVQLLPVEAAGRVAESVHRKFTPRQTRTTSTTPPPAAAAALGSISNPASTTSAAAAASGVKLSGGLSARAALSVLTGGGSGSSKRKRSSLLSRRSGLFTPSAVLDQQQQQQGESEQQQRKEDDHMRPGAKRHCSAAADPAAAAVLGSAIASRNGAVGSRQQQQQQHVASAAAAPPLQFALQPHDFSLAGTQERPQTSVAAVRQPSADADAPAVGNTEARQLRTPKRGKSGAGTAAAAAVLSEQVAAQAEAGASPVSLIGRKRKQQGAGAAAAAAGERLLTPMSGGTPVVRRTRQAAANKNITATDGASAVTPDPATAAAAATPCGSGTAAKRRRIPSRLVPWPCATCTLENCGTASTCDACGAKKPPAATAEQQTYVSPQPPGAAAAAAGDDHVTPPTVARRLASKRKAAAAPAADRSGTARGDAVDVSNAAAAARGGGGGGGCDWEPVAGGSKLLKQQPEQGQQVGGRCAGLPVAADGHGGLNSPVQQQQQQQAHAVTPRSARYLARTQSHTQLQQHQPQQRQSSTPVAGLQLLCSPAAKPAAAAEPAAASAAAAEPSCGKWSCYGCTFDNVRTARKCKMCRAKQPMKPATTVAAAVENDTAIEHDVSAEQHEGRSRHVCTAKKTAENHAAAAAKGGGGRAGNSGGRSGSSSAAAAAAAVDDWLPPSATEDQGLAVPPASLTHSNKALENMKGHVFRLQTTAQDGQQQQQPMAVQVAAKACARRDSRARADSGTAAAAAGDGGGGGEGGLGTPVLEKLANSSRVPRPQQKVATAQKQPRQHYQQQQQQAMKVGAAGNARKPAAAGVHPAKAPFSSSAKGNQQQQQQQRTAADTRGKATNSTAAQEAPAAPPPGSSGPSCSAAAGGSSGSSSQPPVAGLQYLAWTSVSSAVAELARSAVRRLLGLRVCVDGHEEGRVTHMVVGAERRTLKLLLAVANGAVLLTPEWITDSLEKGAWQPVEQYTADVRFAPISAAVRAAQAAGSYQGPLAGKLVVVQCAVQPGGGGGGFSSAAAAAEHKQSLQRLVRALGGRVCGARAAEVCVVCGSSSVPRELPSSAVAVREEWLLQLAETHEGVGNTREFELPRG